MTRSIFKTCLITAGISIPIVAFALQWSNQYGSAPESLREAARDFRLSVTQVCRPFGTSYGASDSKHHSCQAMDISAGTPYSTVKQLESYGLCNEFHPKGYFGATGDHWHVFPCSTPYTRYIARRSQKAWVAGRRKRNRGIVRASIQYYRHRGYGHGYGHGRGWR